MRGREWHLAVLIPARNEEQLLPRCLRSVQAARSRLPASVTSDIVLVSDCSKDKTCEIAEAILQDTGIVVPTEVGRVGTARAIAADIALTRSDIGRERFWLANTDADCEVPEGWLLDHLAVAQRGFMSVAGIVDVDCFEEHDTQVEPLFRSTYVLHPDGTHPHVHGANLGVRADAYLQAGGWAHLSNAEDHDLWSRLHQSGNLHLSDASLLVTTSGRRVGRAPDGFADALAAHNGTAA